jgi:dATP pyrophosphohydrolase
MKPTVDKVQVVVLLRCPRPEVLLLKRPPELGSIWQPVTGSLEPQDTTVLAGARRELLEETGIHHVDALEDMHYEFRFEKPNAEFREHLVAAELVQKPQIVLSSEHIEFEWLDPARALQRVAWDSNRHCIERVLARSAGR